MVADMEEAKQVKPRKKVCRICGQKKWLKDFYKYRNVCKECKIKNSRTNYRKRNPEKTGVFLKDGRAMCMNENARISVYWSDVMLGKLKKMYPVTENYDLSIELGVSLPVLRRKAKKLGLKKDKEWMRDISRRSGRIASLVSASRRKKMKTNDKE